MFNWVLRSAKKRKMPLMDAGWGCVLRRTVNERLPVVSKIAALVGRTLDVHLHDLR